MTVNTVWRHAGSGFPGKDSPRGATHTGFLERLPPPQAARGRSPSRHVLAGNVVIHPATVLSRLGLRPGEIDPGLLPGTASCAARANPRVGSATAASRCGSHCRTAWPASRSGSCAPSARCSRCLVPGPASIAVPHECRPPRPRSETGDVGTSEPVPPRHRDFGLQAIHRPQNDIRPDGRARLAPRRNWSSLCIIRSAFGSRIRRTLRFHDPGVPVPNPADGG